MVTMHQLSREIAAMRTRGETGTLAIVTAVAGHTPQVVGAKLIVSATGDVYGTIGGGRVEHVVIARALEVLRTQQPTTVSFKLKAELGMCCGGQMEVYMEPILPTLRLILFGAGHVAQPTASLAASCGYEVAVVDERSDWLSPARFPSATTRSVAAHGDFLAGAELRPTDSVVITTHNHDYDFEILAAVLRHDVGYVGMIGSTKKVATTFKRLRLQGVTDEVIGRVHAPIGLDICAETPAEIAVAIVGELIRHRRTARSQKKTRGSEVASCSDAAV